MKRIIYLFLLLFSSHLTIAQTNIQSTNSLAEEIMLGIYNPADYLPSEIIDLPDDIVQKIMAEVSPDSLKAYITKLSEFGTRHTASDTVSTTRGVGAARRWVHSKFTEISAAHENRLIPSYLQFDQDICDMGQHRNIIAVLPGTKLQGRVIFLIEGHMDSRCAGPCDIDCEAQGVEDNASGTGLVIELARVMSKLSLEHTIVFMATIGEEQGLFGANAFAQYAQDKNIFVKGVLNNDIVGGVICGATSSEPSCPGENLVDSTQVRLFSFGNDNSNHKSWSRYVKLQYQEEVLPFASVPMQLTLMSAEDRTGRGGDHIPFRERNFTAMRFTSAHEHGDASNGPDYHDRQHTSEDLLGVDTDGDMVIDSFFVDFNYLARNSVINATAASMAAISPRPPGVKVSTTEVEGEIVVEVTNVSTYNVFRIGHRTDSHDFDSVYTLVGNTIDTIVSNKRFNWISTATVDDVGVESFFSMERDVILDITPSGTSNPEAREQKSVELLQNRPNPFDEATYIAWMVYDDTVPQKGEVRIVDLNGKLIESIPVDIKPGMNEILYNHGYKRLGTYVYSLIIEDRVVDSKQMVFAY